MAENLYEYIGIKDATSGIRRWSDSTGKLWEDPRYLPFYVKNRSTTNSITVRWYKYTVTQGTNPPTISSVYYSTDNSTWHSQSPYSNFTIPAGGIMYFRASVTSWGYNGSTVAGNCMYHSGPVDLGGNMGSLVYNTNIKTVYTSSDGTKSSRCFQQMFRYQNSSTYSRSRNVYDVSRLVKPAIYTVSDTSSSYQDTYLHLLNGQTNMSAVGPISYKGGEFGFGPNTTKVTTVFYLNKTVAPDTYQTGIASSGVTMYVDPNKTWSKTITGVTQKNAPSWYII